MGRARYWPIDGRASYWANCLLLDEVWEVELGKFSNQKKKNIVGIRTYAHSIEEPVQPPLG